MEFSTVSCDTFYIVTSSGSPCPGEYIGVPCLTLQQYASNPSRSQNVTFLIEPGMYNLSTLLTVSDGYNFTMSSTNATVTCTSATARFQFNAVENVHISGMTFQGCRNTAIRMIQVISASIMRSTFIDNPVLSGSSTYGGCLYIASSSVTVSESEFQNNRAYYSGGAIYASSSTVRIKRSQFNYNTQEYRYATSGRGGGAIYAAYSNIIINGSLFTHNNAYSYYGDGGAISTSGSRILQIINTTFINNRAGSYRSISGGAVYVSGQSAIIIIQCQFINNSANGNGGGLYYNGGNLIVTQTNFSSNSARGSGEALYKTGNNDIVVMSRNIFSNNIVNSFGGAVYVLGTNSSISVFDCHFTNNTAMTEGGGAIYSNGQYANVILTSSTFHNNSASYCGVLDVDNYNHFSVNLTNSVFIYNTASGQTIGGGVACIRNASINIIDSTFKHNFANFHAGVFYIDESHTTVDGSLFINNSAALDGGVFYTYIHASDYIIRRSQFSENMAGDDGGVMLIGRLNCYLSIDETIFDFNSAGDRGGVIAIIASSMFMEINRTNIFNNTAQFGGVISACNSQVTLLDDSLFVTMDPLLPFCVLYEGDIQIYNITAPTDPEVFTTEFLTTTEQQTTTEPLTSTQRLTTTESQPTTTEPLTTPTTTDPISTTEPLTSDSTTTQPPVTTQELTTEPSGATKDQMDMNLSATSMAANTAPDPLTVKDENATTPSDVDAHTRPTAERASTMPEGSISTTSASTTTTTANKPITTTEILGKDIEHTTSSDQITGVVTDMKNDEPVVIVDSKLAIIGIYVSGSSLVLSFALPIAIFVLMVVLHYKCKRKAKESESANIELTRMREFTTETVKSKHASNIYISPTHNNNSSSEEKRDLSL